MAWRMANIVRVCVCVCATTIACVLPSLRAIAALPTPRVAVRARAPTGGAAGGVRLPAARPDVCQPSEARAAAAQRGARQLALPEEGALLSPGRRA
eukprot:5074508-Prymnesium_polylepis.1